MKQFGFSCPANTPIVVGIAVHKLKNLDKHVLLVCRAVIQSSFQIFN